MAKRGIITHRKTRRLARILGIDQAAAVGLLECLWHVAAEQAPRGDIGKLTDQDIADEMFTSIAPETLMPALCEAGWLDANEADRYLVHDWPEHCDDQVHYRVSRMGNGAFADGTLSRRTKTGGGQGSVDGKPVPRKATDSPEDSKPSPD
ncbi:hypothetical protein EON81_12850, partial [bacterium]